MRRVEVNRFGGPEVVEVVEREIPTPAPGEVVVEMVTAGVNPVDYKMRDGSSTFVQRDMSFPLVLGREGYGRVHAVGAGVDHFGVGAAVWGIPEMGWHTGTHADYVAFSATCLAAAPDDVDPLVLGGSPMAALTAWNAVIDCANVGTGDVVLIHGAGGAVGSWMTQLCVLRGARVFAAASSRHQQRLRSYGAEPLEYTVSDVVADLPPIDVLLDAVYIDTFDRSLDALAAGARVVAIPTLANIEPAAVRGFDAHIAHASPNPSRLVESGELLRAGRVGVAVAEAVALDDLPRAHRILETGHAPGKLVVDFSH